jgi:hypothetical protein
MTDFSDPAQLVQLLEELEREIAMRQQPLGQAAHDWAVAKGNREKAYTRAFMDVDDRAIGVERRYTGAPPEVELVVVRFNGRDAELVLDDGDVLVFDAEELRKVLEVPEDFNVTDRDCPRCHNGRWTDPNGIERRCAYCGGVGRVAA